MHENHICMMGGEEGNHSWGKGEMKTAPEYSAAGSEPASHHMQAHTHPISFFWWWVAWGGTLEIPARWESKGFSDFLQQLLWELVLEVALPPPSKAAAIFLSLGKPVRRSLILKVGKKDRKLSFPQPPPGASLFLITDLGPQTVSLEQLQG